MTFTKEEREKNKSILLASLNYLLENHAMDIVFDDYSPSKEFYLSEMKQTELDIQKSRSKQIKNRLDKHINSLKHRSNSSFNHYIKLHTGYDIDIFEEFKTNVIPIATKRSIGNNDVYLIEKYLKAYETHPEEQENVVLLKALLAAYEAEIKKLIDLYGVETETFHYVNDKRMTEVEYKAFLHKWQLFKETSPNGLASISVEISGTTAYASTYVVISLPAGSGSIYAVKGAKLPIKAYWKDDHTVVIETKKEYEHYSQYQQVSSYGEVVKIDYRFV